MGASQSNKQTSRQLSSLTDYQKIIQFYGLKDKKITKNDFITILSSCDKICVEKIWNFQFGEENCSLETKFDDIVNRFRSITGEKCIKYLLEINNTESSDSRLRELCRWLTFSSSADGIHEIIKKSIPLVDNKEIDINDFLNWIDRNLPDLGVDFARYIYKTLLGQQLNITSDITSEMSAVVSKLNSSLISLRVMVLLCASLPMSYKVSERRDNFLFSNLNGWRILYSSDTHGLSTSRFKDNCFDYDGNILMLVKTDSGIFCLASDVGLKEDWNLYGGGDARFLQLEPIFKKYISGTRPVNNNKTGIIFSHFTAKSGRRGLFIGHNPLKSAAIEIDEDLLKISVLGSSELIRLIEVWAVGSSVEDKVARLKDVRQWEHKEVNKHKNRKIKAEDWVDSPDREILGMGGVNVRHGDLVGGIDRELERHE